MQQPFVKIQANNKGEKSVGAATEPREGAAQRRRSEKVTKGNFTRRRLAA